MDRFLAIVIGCPLGFVIMYYKRAVKEFIGEVGFAEKIFGMGGTNTFIVLLGILLFVGSLMYGLGTLQGMVQSTAGKFF